MLILLITAQLYAPFCHSLKDKRSLARPLISQLQGRFKLSVMESGSQDKLQVLEISLCALCPDTAYADSLNEKLLRFVEGSTDAQLMHWEAEYR